MPQDIFPVLMHRAYHRCYPLYCEEDKQVHADILLTYRILTLDQIRAYLESSHIAILALKELMEVDLAALHRSCPPNPKFDAKIPMQAFLLITHAFVV